MKKYTDIEWYDYGVDPLLLTRKYKEYSNSTIPNKRLIDCAKDGAFINFRRYTFSDPLARETTPHFVFWGRNLREQTPEQIKRSEEREKMRQTWNEQIYDGHPLIEEIEKFGDEVEEFVRKYYVKFANNYNFSVSNRIYSKLVVLFSVAMKCNKRGPIEHEFLSAKKTFQEIKEIVEKTLKKEEKNKKKS